MRYLVERALSGLPPDEWEEVGVSDQSGKGAPARAVEDLAEYAGKYRVRPEGDPSGSFALFSVGPDGTAHHVDAF